MDWLGCAEKRVGGHKSFAADAQLASSYAKSGIGEPNAECDPQFRP
jgi:hypothetical protein